MAEKCSQAMVPVASWVRVWSIRMAMGSPGLIRPSTKCARMIFWTMFDPMAVSRVSLGEDVSIGLQLIPNTQADDTYHSLCPRGTGCIIPA